MNLGRFKYRFIKLCMLIGSDFVHYVDDEVREMLAEIANCVSEEERQPGKRLELLDSLASEDAFQTVLASQPNTHFSKYYFCGLVRR